MVSGKFQCDVFQLAFQIQKCPGPWLPLHNTFTSCNAVSCLEMHLHMHRRALSGSLPFLAGREEASSGSCLVCYCEEQGQPYWLLVCPTLIFAQIKVFWVSAASFYLVGVSVLIHCF